MNCLKNNRGLSLIEIMVALSILAVVGAIAVPQFANYRKSAAESALQQSTRNTEQAFKLCRATKQFSLCDELTEINMPPLGGTTPGESKATGGASWCADTEVDISGDPVKACIQFNSDGTTSNTVNKRYCYKDGTGHADCANNQYDTSAPGSCPNGDTVQFSDGVCEADGDCSGGAKCMQTGAAANGACASGTCS